MKSIKILLLVLLSLISSVLTYAAYDTLGATVIHSTSSASTRFAIWNPDNITPACVYVQLPGQTTFTQYALAFQPPYSDNGINQYTDVYSVTVPQNLNLCQYYFTLNGVTVRDPYAKMTTGIQADGTTETQFVNTGTQTNPIPATSPTNPPPVPGPCNGVVIDMAQVTNYKFAAPPALAEPTDAIVYELDVMDYTSNPNAGVKNGGTFTGLAQSGTCNGQTTGLQHLIDLGITHVQIMPMYTYSFCGFSYNWGYNPIEYNVPQAQFSMYPLNQYMNRIQEVQNMVNTYHQSNIRVIMDVVYNHTYAASIFAPNSPVTNAYYITNNGQLVDYTGCGNTINGANPMVSNFIADSLAYWMKAYDLDGYRFDLLGVFDYTTASSWVQYLNNQNPGRSYLIYGEPWSAGGQVDANSLREGNVSCSEYMNNGVLTQGSGCFNGQFRTALEGSNQDGTGGGYIFNNPSSNGGWSSQMGQIACGFNGSIRASGTQTLNSVPQPLSNQWANAYANMPGESVNYISCHDGLCLWDKICATTGQHAWSNIYNQQIDMFSAGILMTSQGVAFFQEGDEFLRSKSGNNNTYNSPLTVNWIDWSAKNTNINAFNYYKKLIAMRKAYGAFTQSTWAEINANSQVYTCANSSTPVGVLVSNLKDDAGNKYIVIYSSNADYAYQIPANSGNWILVTNINDCGLNIPNDDYPQPGTTFAPGQNVLCCGTSVTVLANESNPDDPTSKI